MHRILCTALLIAIALARSTWADDALLKEIQQAIGARRALAVHVGAGKGQLVLALGQRTQYLVHGIEPEAASVAAARQAIEAAGLCGRLLVEQGDLKVLPHVNGLANVVVIDDVARLGAAGLAAAEALRILAPEGLLCVGSDQRAVQEWLGPAAPPARQSGSWTLIRKPRPAGVDEWSHKWHDATRNSASQDALVKQLGALQWIGSDPYTWQMRHGRTAGGRVVLVYDGNAGMSRWGTYKEDAIFIEVFDAHSGVLQWKRKFEPGMKLGFDPVVAGDRIIIPIGKELHALDANTGDSLLHYKDAGDVRGGVVADGVVAVMEPATVKGLDLATGRLLWTFQSRVPVEVRRDKRSSVAVSGMDSYCLPAGEGMIFICERSKDAPTRLLGLDLKTGQEKWAFSDPAIGTVYSRHWYYQGRLIVSTSTGLWGLPVRNRDAKPWSIPVTHFGLDKQTKALAITGEGFKDAYKNTFGVNGLVWVREGTQSKMVFAPKDKAQFPTAAKTWIGFDVQTGREVRRLGYDIDGGWQQRCFPDQATPAFILSSNNEIVPLDSGPITNYRAFRGMCGEGPFYGNGLYYVPTHYCIFCYPMVRGTLAVASDPPPPTPVADDQRLEKGPAYNPQPREVRPDPAAWPVYRQNPKRTSGTTAAVDWPPAPEPLWKADFKERIVSPVIADGRCFVTLVNQGRIVALDAATGKQLWTRWAGPRIDLPPTVHGDLVLFGSHDGYLYALRAADGELAWRFGAAPERRRMIACDRVESSWPLMGSVLISDGTLYCLAGRITRCDGGMHMYALDPFSGQMKWHRALSGTRDPQLATGIPCWKELEGQMMNNLLAVDGDELRLPDQHQVWQFSAKTGDWMPRKAPAAPPTTSPEDKPKEPGYLAWYDQRFPYHGFDRPTIGWLMHGMDPIAELRHPFESGTPACFPDSRSTGVIIKRIRKSNEGQFTVLTPATPDQFQAGWDEKTAWKVRLMARENLYADVYAPVAAGDTAYLACTTYDPPQKDGVIRAISLKDGSEKPSVPLPACPIYDGMAAAGGKLFVALRDGSVICLGKK